MIAMLVRQNNDGSVQSYHYSLLYGIIMYKNFILIALVAAVAEFYIVFNSMAFAALVVFSALE